MESGWPGMKWVWVVLLAIVPLQACKKEAPPASKATPTPAPEFRAPRRIKHVEPAHPKGPKAAGQAGEVVLELEISLTGKVTGAQVKQSLSPEFDRAALEAARQWEYTPTIFKGEPAVMYLTVTVTFKPAAPPPPPR